MKGTKRVVSCGKEDARVRGIGLLVTVGVAQARWLSGVLLRQSVGLGGRGEVQVMAGRNAGTLVLAV